MNVQPGTKRIALLLSLAAVMIGFWVYSIIFSGQDSVVSVPTTLAQRVSVVNGLTILTLDADTQVLSGIRAEPLASSSHRAEVAAYGTVLDLQPFIDLRSRYMAATAAAEVARATAAASRQESERSRTLYQDNQNISLKAYQTAQAIYQADQARATAAALEVQNIRGSLRQQAGETLARWVLAARSSAFERLLKRQEVLLRVVVPLGANVQAPATIQIAANNNQRLSAFLVSASPQSDPSIQGNAFIYRTAAALASGAHLAAYLPMSRHAEQGVLIPASAIVWYGGQPWAYVQLGADRFARHAVSQQAPMNNGFFVTDGIKAEARVVISGAQLLLSEELLPQPGSPSSACKDPECD